MHTQGGLQNRNALWSLATGALRDIKGKPARTSPAF
jgi:hypothetical protein